MIKFENVTKNYGHNLALNGINLQINHGEFISLVGMSGAGKSTLLKNMALQEVLNALQHRYNIKIKADDNLVKCSISANFTNVSLQNIMVIISKLVKGKVVQEGQVYHFKGKGC